MGPRIGITFSDEIRVEPYLAAIRESGGEPIAIGPLVSGRNRAANAEASTEELDALLLAGGVDVNPELYGQVPAAETEQPNLERDRTELALLRDALDRGLPVLGICRGMQMLNVALGGSLIQDRDGHVTRTEDKSLPAHTVEVVDGSRLGAIYETNSLPVNSRHHQAVDRVGSGLRVAARAEDGTVEALESTGPGFTMGVQWHPEDMALQKPLFDEFVKQAAGNR